MAIRLRVEASDAERYHIVSYTTSFMTKDDDAKPSAWNLHTARYDHHMPVNWWHRVPGPVTNGHMRFYLLYRRESLWRLLLPDTLFHDLFHERPLLYDFEAVHVCALHWGTTEWAALVGYCRETILASDERNPETCLYPGKASNDTRREMKRDFQTDIEEEDADTESESDDDEDVADHHRASRPWLHAYSYVHQRNQQHHKGVHDFHEWLRKTYSLTIKCDACREIVRRVANIYRQTIASLPAGHLGAPVDERRTVHTWHGWHMTCAQALHQYMNRDQLWLIMSYCSSAVPMLAPYHSISAGFWWQVLRRDMRTDTFVRDYHMGVDRLITLQVGQDICPLDWLSQHGLPWYWFFAQPTPCNRLTIPAWSNSPLAEEWRLMCNTLGFSKDTPLELRLLTDGCLAFACPSTEQQPLPSSRRIAIHSTMRPWLAKISAWPLELDGLPGYCFLYWEVSHQVILFAGLAPPLYPTPLAVSIR